MEVSLTDPIAPPLIVGVISYRHALLAHTTAAASAARSRCGYLPACTAGTDYLVLDPIAERGGAREKMHQTNHTVLRIRGGTREKMQLQNHIYFTYETRRIGQHTQVSHRARAHNTASAAPSVTCS